MLIYILLFILGLMAGSFLNVLIVRVPLAESVVFHRSHCRKCKKALPWYDLLPIISFALLSGKCRFCQEKISWQYPVIELLTAILFALGFWLTGFLNQSPWLLVLYLPLFAVLISISVIDLKTMLLPDILTYTGVGISLILAITLIVLGEMKLIDAILGLVVGAGFLGGLVLLGRGKWMGEGDIFLGAMMGLTLGWPRVFIGLFLAFLIGSVVGLLLIGFKKKTLKSAVPFGPFLALGILLALFFGQQIIGWYLRY